MGISNALFVQWITGQEHGSGTKQTTFPISFNEVFIAFLTQRDTGGSAITTVITKLTTTDITYDSKTSSTYCGNNILVIGT